MKHSRIFVAVAAALALSTAFANDQKHSTSKDTQASPQAQSSQSGAMGSSTTSGKEAGGTSSAAGGSAAAGGSKHHKMGKAGAGADTDAIKQAQEKLAAEGIDIGTPDGKMGPKTKAGIKKYQQQKGLSASGELDEATMSSLGISSGSSGASASKSKDTSAASGGSSSKPSDESSGKSGDKSSSSAAGGASGTPSSGSQSTPAAAPSTSQKKY